MADAHAHPAAPDARGDPGEFQPDPPELEGQAGVAGVPADAQQAAAETQLGLAGAQLLRPVARQVAGPIGQRVAPEEPAELLGMLVQDVLERQQAYFGPAEAPGLRGDGSVGASQEGDVPAARGRRAGRLLHP
ncbi:hypothetical protein Pen01_17300 [Phytomonospora endophytica]|nr:hypothetical protein Pen01_17300 [Phytomonospora endophytica]